MTLELLRADPQCSADTPPAVTPSEATPPAAIPPAVTPPEAAPPGTTTLPPSIDCEPPPCLSPAV